MKILYLSVRNREKNRPNPTGKANGWKRVLNTLTIHYGERLSNPGQPANDQ